MIIFIILILITIIISILISLKKEVIICYATVGNQTYINENLCGTNITEDQTPLYQFYLKARKMKKVSYQLYIKYKWSSLIKEPNIIGENGTKNFGVSFIIPKNWKFRAYMAIGWTDWKSSGQKIEFGASNTHITNIEFKKMDNQ